MSITNLQPELIEQLEQIAVEQAVRPEELLETAIRTYLRQVEREKIESEAEAFRSMHAELVASTWGNTSPFTTIR